MEASHAFEAVEGFEGDGLVLDAIDQAEKVLVRGEIGFVKVEFELNGYISAYIIISR